jgi:hypothetical protein
VEREVDGAWRAVEEPGRVCTMEAWLLKPRATRTATTELRAALAAGRHLLVARCSTRDVPYTWGRGCGSAAPATG